MVVQRQNCRTVSKLDLQGENLTSKNMTKTGKSCVAWIVAKSEYQIRMCLIVVLWAIPCESLLLFFAATYSRLAESTSSSAFRSLRTPQYQDSDISNDAEDFEGVEPYGIAVFLPCQM